MIRWRSRGCRCLLSAMLAVVGLVTIPTGKLAAQAEPPATKQAIDFNRDIRPLLSDHCYKCHGPDAKKRTTEMRLDTRQGALADLGDYRPITPGDPAASEVIRRITSDDPDERMPPPDAPMRLSPEQVATLTKWVREGAQWDEHWSFVAPQRPKPPQQPGDAWRRNAIDDFIARRLQQQELKPSPEAGKTTLLRRLHLNLTGLPPSPAELKRFLADNSPDAYEQALDRLLATPAYGERMALVWLDAARYADTSGYQSDGPRSMWRWRDWVIEAFNHNMPFDEFTLEQIAGDLLAKLPEQDKPVDYKSAWRGRLIRNPEKLNHLIASAMHRNHRGNAEGGIIPDEYQVEYVVDRVDATATIWLGLTLGCCRCHDHKYDPLGQKDFYSLFAFFNNVAEYGRAIKQGNSAPFIKAPTPNQLDELRNLDLRVAAAEQRVRNQQSQRKRERLAWEQRLTKLGADSEAFASEVGGSIQTDAARSLRISLDNNLKAEAEPKASWANGKPEFTQGALGQAAVLDGKRHIEFAPSEDFANFGYFDRFSFTAWIHPKEETGTVVSRMNMAPDGDGYAVHLQDGKLQVNLVKRWLDDSLRVETAEPISLDKWSHIAVVYDGSRETTGIRVYVDGQRCETKVLQGFINQTFAADDQPVRIGAGSANFEGAIDELHIYSDALADKDVEILAEPASIAAIVQRPEKERSAAQVAKLDRYFLQHHASNSLRDAEESLNRLNRERGEFVDSLPTLMVMQELREPRKSFILKRGEYDKPGARVEPDVPAIFPRLPDGAPRNRIGLARWLVSRDNPLTARVAVNRIWQIHFGTGLVRSAEDFGVQGQRPTHPELLDWLAVELIDSGWDLKHMHRLIAGSATYRQSSAITREALAKDPENRWLSRSPRYRLPAESVRDQALAISGLLDSRLGGPSVRPYQPAGLWKEIATDTEYDQSHGADLYRRSLYTYWKRTVSPPTMTNFDAPTREACIVQRSRTNTPLQALTLMNETSFIEAARVFAQRILAEQHSDDARLEQMFLAAVCRTPKPKEMNILRQLLQAGRDAAERNSDEAKKLIATGEYPVDPELDPMELAAWTTMASMILNLDEVISRE